jgi:nucleotide-binding universal stress UspA family protein
MFSTIYVPLDNSEHSNAAAEVAIGLAHAFGSRIVGSHVYAARMHDYRFKQMEYTLPEEYQDEQELERQRKIHDTLITRGLRLISDSYTDVAQARCAAEGIAFEPRTMDGRNWEVLVEDINTNHYDLVVMGAQGFGATREAQLGSVCDRVVRRIRTDTLVVKEPQAWTERPEGNIAVCVDGSPQSFGGLRIALELGKALGRPVEAVAVYDPYLHYAMFNGIVGVLSQEASKVFRFKEQEQLHEEIIDTGLAKIYESHLQVARRVAEQEGVDLKVTLLDGKAWEKVVHWSRTTRPWLMVMGRIGVHSDEQMDIGSNSENMLRAVGCNVLLASSTYVPPVDVRAEEVIIWTPEANQKMERVPAFVRGIARTAIHRWALERGTSIISRDVVNQACLDILPPSAAKAMGITAERVAIEHELAQARAERAAPGSAGHAGKTYICGECGYAARDVLPVACPVCRVGPERFAIIDTREIEQAAEQEGPLAVDTTFDGAKVVWTEEARRLLFSMADAYARRRAKARIEKLARTRRLPAVTLEFASPVIQEMIGDLARLHANGMSAEAPETVAAEEDEREEGSNPTEAAVQVPLDATGQDGLSADAGTALKGDESADAGEPEQRRDEAGDTAAERVWTEEAERRLERVPQGYMRDMTRDLIVRHAEEVRAETITLEVAEGGIELAKQEMVAMIAARANRKAARAQAAGASAGCPVGAGRGHVEESVTEACPVAGSEARSERAQQGQDASAPLTPTVGQALNEVKPLFIARLARYYAPGAGGRQAPAEMDFVWTSEAESLLAAVPEYCQELARWRVEWTAYKQHLGRLITPEVWHREHADWSELADHLHTARLRRLEWQPEAMARLDAVPEFVREQVALAVEINAAHLGHATVSGEAFDAVSERWVAEGRAAAAAKVRR